jgi:hypothetical protein
LADGERGTVLGVGVAFLDEPQQRRDAVLLDYGPAVPAIILAREGGDAGGGAGAATEVAGPEHGDLRPDEVEDGVGLRDGRQVHYWAAVMGFGDRGSDVGDAEEPGEVGDGAVEQDGRLPEGARRGGDGADDAAPDEAAAEAAVDHRSGCVDGLAGVREDATRGALVELVTPDGHAAEQAGDALQPGRQFALALIPARLRVVRRRDQLLGEVNSRPREGLHHVAVRPRRRGKAVQWHGVQRGGMELILGWYSRGGRELAQACNYI